LKEKHGISRVSFSFERKTMNDQSQMMNQQPPQIPMMNQPPQILSQPQMISQSQAMNQSQLMMMQSQSNPLPMLNRSFNKGWSQQQGSKPNYSASMKPSKLGRSNWKGKNVGGGGDKRKDLRRMEKPVVSGGPSNSGGGVVGGVGGGVGYKPPTLHELQSQNRLKARKFYQKKKFNNNVNNNNNSNNGKNNRFAPYAPRNTTSFIIRAKRAGGIAELVSPCPVTPAVLPTPRIFSPSREVLGDMAKEEWGVDGYGSMKGLIRLRSPGHEHELVEEEEDENGGSSESDVEEHVEVERRLDHDLSRFEMIYPNYSGVEYNNVLENRVDDQDSHIAQLEEENLTLKERLFLMEREMGDLRRRLQFLERQSHVVMEDPNEEVVENGSENDSDGGSDAPAVTGCENNARMGGYANQGRRNGEENDGASDNEGVGDVCMSEFVPDEKGGEERNELVVKEVIAEKNESKDEEIVKENVVKVEEMRTEAKNEEESRKELVPDVVNAAREDGVKARHEFVHDQDESMSEELGNVCSEKSIGDGD
jgi:hypothetical protein